MEVMQIANEILENINLLKKMQIVIKERAENKAIALSEYDKSMAITIMKLKNGVEMQLDDVTISNPPATLIEKIAKGICWEAKQKMELSEALYKSCISNIDATQAILNGYQSLNKHLT
jgi:hypothetical protein